MVSAIPAAGLLSLKAFNESTRTVCQRDARQRRDDAR
jgi:hypothetical protein